MAVLRNVSDMATATDGTECEMWGGGGGGRPTIYTAAPQDHSLRPAFNSNFGNQREFGSSINPTKRSEAMHEETPVYIA
jgi:hypothetical protein